MQKFERKNIQDEAKLAPSKGRTLIKDIDFFCISFFCALNQAYKNDKYLKYQYFKLYPCQKNQGINCVSLINLAILNVKKFLNYCVPTSNCLISCCFSLLTNIDLKLCSISLKDIKINCVTGNRTLEALMKSAIESAA